MTEAQKFLIEKGYNDLIVNIRHGLRLEERIYVSDAMMEFLKEVNDGCNQEIQRTNRAKTKMEEPVDNLDLIRDVSSTIVDQILSDLTDRKGFDQEWNQVDDDIQEEIKQTWVEIVYGEIISSFTPT